MRSARVIRRGFLAAASLAAATFTQAAEPVFAHCLGLEDKARLACYDEVAKRLSAPAQETKLNLGAEPSADAKASPPVNRAAMPGLPVGGGTPAASFFTERWELDEKPGPGGVLPSKLFEISAYRPMYLLFAHYSNNINTSPSSPAPDHQSLFHDYRSTETKFQISFKTKLLEDLPLRSRLWFGYTQTSYFQAYNGKLSAPFRETNYEPELMWMAPATPEFAAFGGKMFGAGIVHQSNGQSLPRSRSWNRIYATAAFERDGFAFVVRPWWRLPENGSKDDNPDISDYVGRIETQLMRQWGRHVFALTARNSLRSTGRGSIRLDWTYRLNDNLHLYLQAFTGYGENLIDYNHRQSNFGAGVTLVDWR